jgi:hypothetical protein
MRFIFLAAFAAIMLGLAAITIANAVPPGVPKLEISNVSPSVSVRGISATR